MPDGVDAVGWCSTISVNVTVSWMKTAVKTKARKTNNQASFCGSILKTVLLCLQALPKI
jgi:hypothetical protein